VVEFLLVRHDTAVLEVIEKNDIPGSVLLILLNGRQRQIKFACRRALDQHPAVFHHTPDKSGTIEAL